LEGASTDGGEGFDNYERVVPGCKGFEGATLIAPGVFITGVMESLLKAVDANKGLVNKKSMKTSRVRLEEYIVMVKGLLAGQGAGEEAAKEEEEEKTEAKEEVVAPPAAEEGKKEDEVRAPAAGK